MAKQGQFWSMYDALRKENNLSQVKEGRYNNPDHDKHYDQASNETDPVKSNELLVTMNDIIIDDVVLIPIVQRASERYALAKTLRKEISLADQSKRSTGTSQTGTGLNKRELRRAVGEFPAQKGPGILR